MTADQPDPPFVRIGPADPQSPVILSVPHAGRDYSPRLAAMARLKPATLALLEDRLVDRLIWRATAAGATALVARAPRAEIDLNRDEREIDPTVSAMPPLPGFTALQSARIRGGLGLVPARIAGHGPIWLRRLAGEEVARRIETIHRPYHAALDALLAATRARFGVAVLLDCHSMPPRPGEPGVVVGDRYGTSCAAALSAAAVAAAARHGQRVAINAPYAGGHISARHGRPAAGIHALQIEIDRSLYLDRSLREPGRGFDGIAAMIAGIAAALAECALPQAIAAE